MDADLELERDLLDGLQLPGTEMTPVDWDELRKPIRVRHPELEP